MHHHIGNSDRIFGPKFFKSTNSKMYIFPKVYENIIMKYKYIVCHRNTKNFYTFKEFRSERWNRGNFQPNFLYVLTAK